MIVAALHVLGALVVTAILVAGVLLPLLIGSGRLVRNFASRGPRYVWAKHRTVRMIPSTAWKVLDWQFAGVLARFDKERRAVLVFPLNAMTMPSPPLMLASDDERLSLRSEQGFELEVVGSFMRLHISESQLASVGCPATSQETAAMRQAFRVQAAREKKAGVEKAP